MAYTDYKPKESELRMVDVIDKQQTEIERLRAKTKADAEAWHEQEEKIERLRAVLTRIADYHDEGSWTKEVAREALTAA